MARFNAESVNAVPVEPLAEAVLRSGIPFAVIAKNCGWLRADRIDSGDATRLKRRVGLATYTTRGRRGCRQRFISYDNAVIIAEAIGVAPVDVGL